MKPPEVVENRIEDGLEVYRESSPGCPPLMVRPSSPSPSGMQFLRRDALARTPAGAPQRQEARPLARVPGRRARQREEGSPRARLPRHGLRPELRGREEDGEA
jgi:hypothetical protein